MEVTMLALRYEPKTNGWFRGKPLPTRSYDDDSTPADCLVKVVRRNLDDYRSRNSVCQNPNLKNDKLLRTAFCYKKIQLVIELREILPNMKKNFLPG